MSNKKNSIINENTIRNAPFHTRSTEGVIHDFGRVPLTGEGRMVQVSQCRFRICRVNNLYFGKGLSMRGPAPIFILRYIIVIAFKSAINAEYIGCANGLKISNVVNMEKMFAFATNFKQDLSGWNVSHICEPTDFACGSGIEYNLLMRKHPPQKLEGLCWVSGKTRRQLSTPSQHLQISFFYQPPPSLVKWRESAFIPPLLNFINSHIFAHFFGSKSLTGSFQGIT